MKQVAHCGLRKVRGQRLRCCCSSHCVVNLSFTPCICFLLSLQTCAQEPNVAAQEPHRPISQFQEEKLTGPAGVKCPHPFSAAVGQAHVVRAWQLEVFRDGGLLAEEYPKGCYQLFFFNVYSFFVCLFERQSVSRGGAEREREREKQNPKQAPGSELSAQSRTWGSNSSTMRL